MHKRMIVVFSLLLAVAALGFTSGQSEAQAGPDAELISAEGTLVLQDQFWPRLETPQGTYRLMAPRTLPAGVEVAQGDTIAVEGYLVPGPRMGWQKSDEKYLAVTRAVIDGEEYLVNRPFGPGSEDGHCCEDEQRGHHHGHMGFGRHGMMAPPMQAPGFGWSQS
jgi:hypothetical protein